MKIIGLCGPSCCGKTTIAKKLEKELDANVISLDSFYIKGSPAIYTEHEGEKIRTFERPELFNHERLIKSITELQTNKQLICEMFNMEQQTYSDIELQKKEYLILEGFLLFQNQKLMELMNHKFYLHISSDLMISRRKNRSDRAKSDGSFLKIGPIEWEKYGIGQKDLPNVSIIDCAKEIDHVFTEILNKIGK